MPDSTPARPRPLAHGRAAPASPPRVLWRKHRLTLLLALFVTTGCGAGDAVPEARAVSVPQLGSAHPAEVAPPGTEGALTALVIEKVSVARTDRDEVLPDRTVVIIDGWIRRVGPAAEVQLPEGAAVVDGRGRYLVPGMAEMHGHLPGGGASAPEVEDLLFLYLANGVTLVRGMQGHPAQLSMRDAIEAGELLGPRLVVSSPAMGWGNVPSAAEAPVRVRAFAEAGYDLVKIGEGPEPEVFRALVEAADAAGLPVAGHVPDEVGLQGAFAAGQVTIDHLDNYVEELVPAEDRAGIAPLWGVAGVAHLAAPERLDPLVRETVEAGVAQVPTMVLWEVFFGARTGDDLRNALPELRYMPRETVEGWVRQLASRHAAIGTPEERARVVELRRQAFRALHAGGATFLLGTDSPQLFSVPGFQNLREMELWAELGMTPFEILHAGTLAVAEHLGEADIAGSVAEGRRADLLLLESNPLEEINRMAHRAGVVRAGRWIPEEEIQARLEAIAERAAGGN